MRGAARARVFLPLNLAQNLHVLQASDLRDTTHLSVGAPTYSNLNVRVKSPSQVQAVEDAIKKMGFRTFSIIDATPSQWRNSRLTFFISSEQGVDLGELLGVGAVGALDGAIEFGRGGARTDGDAPLVGEFELGGELGGRHRLAECGWKAGLVFFDRRACLSDTSGNQVRLDRNFLAR